MLSSQHMRYRSPFRQDKSVKNVSKVVKSYFLDIKFVSNNGEVICWKRTES